MAAKSFTLLPYLDNIIYLPRQLGGCGTTPFLSLAERSGAYEYI